MYYLASYIFKMPEKIYFFYQNLSLVVIFVQFPMYYVVLRYCARLTSSEASDHKWNRTYLGTTPKHGRRWSCLKVLLHNKHTFHYKIDLIHILVPHYVHLALCILTYFTLQFLYTFSFAVCLQFKVEQLYYILPYSGFQPNKAGAYTVHNRFHMYAL